MIEFLDSIKNHFEEYYPREGCGILGVIKGKLQWFPCKNVAGNNEDFIIDSKQYIDIARKCDIVGIVHSHPDASPEASISDIKNCDTLEIPYYIFSYPEMELNKITPKNISKPLSGRLYEFGVNDCFEAMRDYLDSQGIVIPARSAFEDDWWKKDLDYFTDEIIKDYGYTRVEGNMQKNDVIIFSINSQVGNHCGVYLGDDLFFHHAENRLSCKENLYPYWKQYITGVYRHAS